YGGGGSTQAPSLTAYYGSDVLESARSEVSGFVGVLQVAVEGQKTPVLVDPTHIDLQITLSGATARTHATPTFDVSALGSGEHLAIFQGLIPTRGLAHDIRVTMGGQMHESFVADASSTHDSRLMSSEVPSSSGIEGICDMVPLGLLANAAAPF